MNSKRQLGQFFTINTDYILSGFSQYVYGKNITDPFAGDGDLLEWAEKYGASSLRGYDIDPAYTDNRRIFLNNSLKNPKFYDFVLTNPPYLYQNKLKDNSILLKSKHTDLYQLALEKIMCSNEGIIIAPINFLSAGNSKYIRHMFLSKFNIIRTNYFAQQVFKDTSYNVIAFYYKKKAVPKQNMIIDLHIYPAKRLARIELFQKCGWQIGGEFLAKINAFANRLKITRLEEDDLQNGNYAIRTAYNHLSKIKEFMVDYETLSKIKRNIVILKAIDTGAQRGRIRLEDIRKYNLDAIVSVKTSRNQISLIFPESVSLQEQEILISLFNRELEKKRSLYHSLFMTNYRDNDRKRVSFNFVYNFISYLYFSKLKGTENAKTQHALF